MKTDNVENNTAVPSDERLQQLKELFPECISEGVFDTEKFHKVLHVNKVIGGGKSDKNREIPFQLGRYTRSDAFSRHIHPATPKAVPARIPEFQ